MPSHSTTKYLIKEVYPTLQGEGMNSGVPMVLLRFGGCNLSCDFCDTDFEGGTEYKLNDLLLKVKDARRINNPAGLEWVMLTGGEPMLQVDMPLLSELKSLRFKIALETNGTIEIPKMMMWYIDHIAVSPKQLNLTQTMGDELKLPWRAGFDFQTLNDWKMSTHFRNYYVQPIDEKDGYEANLKSAIQNIMEVRGWRLNLQMHKMIGLR